MSAGALDHTTLDRDATAATRRRYDRTARWYDRMGSQRMDPWRARLWQRVQGERVLEVGVGTGQNFPYYPANATITAIDLSPRMLDHARARARHNGVHAELREADVQSLPYSDGSFDTVVATCVLCSVPDPVLGLFEMRRVLVPGGQLLTLDHVLSQRPALRAVMRRLNLLLVRLTGANIDRDTVGNVRRAGFESVRVDDLWFDIMKLIEARSPATA